MKHAAIDQVLQRAAIAKTDSDFSYFFSLLLAAEALAKTTVLGLIAAIGDDKDRNRYRLEHSLARSDGLGDWSKAIEDALTGPASQYLVAEARAEQTELTRLSRAGEWQFDSVSQLKATLDYLGVDAEEVPIKSDMKRWFRLFVTLRNKTRAHGATQSAKATKAAEHLLRSLELFLNNHSLFKRPWAFLHRNLSGKYRVSSITNDVTPFDYLRKGAPQALQNGVYVFAGVPRLVPLLQSDAELQDFYFGNGGLTGKRFELLSYYSGNKMEGDASAYQIPPGTLPASETEGHGELFPRGNCFSNVPDVIHDYVPRLQLEEDLLGLLSDDKRTIVTLVGSGGIGKTSLALKVIPRLYDSKSYDAIVWFSARDIDLQQSGPKPVRPQVLSPEDMGQYYAQLVLPMDTIRAKGFNARAFFETQLKSNDLGSCLFVFDNFETTQNPTEMFTWIDTFVRPPNKILITTRLRSFKGDYPLEVPGMTDEEARLLVAQTAGHLKISTLLSGSYVDDLIAESSGHPYVIKILLGEVAKAGRTGSIPRLVAGSDEILTALFERTYASLSPCAQRAFMTLAAWNSSVPRIALEAILLRSIEERLEVEKGIESLLQFSIAEIQIAPTDKQEFIALPLVASVFGKKKLSISPSKTAVQADVETLQMLGPSRRDDIHLGLAKRLENFMANISRRIDSGESVDSYQPMLEMICRAYYPGWLLLARLHMEVGTSDGLSKAKDALRQYLEIDSTSESAIGAWRTLAHCCYKTNDALGEIHAFIERAQMSSVPFSDLSNTANRLNQLLHERIVGVDREERRQLASRIAAVMKKRVAEADADDLSRMAWLAFYIGEEAKAREYVSAGLAIDGSNYHCQRLASRLATNH